jgi:hypothetical protein
MVWASSPEAHFIKGKFVWAHWDVVDLKKLIEQHKDDNSFLTLTVKGIPDLGL